MEVIVCGNLQVQEQITRLRVSLRDDLLQERTFGVLSLLPDEAKEAPPEDAGMQADDGDDDSAPDAPTPNLSLPVSTDLDQGTGSGFAVVEGLLEGRVVARFDRRVLAFENTDFVELPLNADCYGMICPAGQTCVDGGCEEAPEVGEAPRCTGDR